MSTKDRMEEPLDDATARIVERARALPREDEPQRDLWPAVARRVRGEEPAPRRAPFAFGWAGASATAVALVVATAVATLWLSGGLAESPLDDAARTRAIADSLRSRDGVAGVHASLLEILEERRDEIPPETLAALEENLHAIDRAIAEIHLALEEHPDNPALNLLLAETYRREAELLGQLEWWGAAPEEAS